MVGRTAGRGRAAGFFKHFFSERTNSKRKGVERGKEGGALHPRKHSADYLTKRMQFLFNIYHKSTPFEPDPALRHFGNFLCSICAFLSFPLSNYFFLEFEASDKKWLRLVFAPYLPWVLHLFNLKKKNIERATTYTQLAVLSK